MLAVEGFHVTMQWVLLFACIHLPYCQSHPCTVTYDKRLQGETADCSNRNLQEVPQELPSSIVGLILTNNRLTNLSNCVFLNYSKLNELHLSNNNIASFQEDCFEGISNLTNLDLSGNKFNFDEQTFKRNVFKPLTNLRILGIQTTKSTPQPTYFASHVLEDLIHLQEIALNTWPDEKYRYAFAHLRDLRTLRILGMHRCNLRIIRNNTFEVLKDLRIETLQIYCYVTSVELGVLVPLSRLQKWIFNTAYESTLSLRNITALLKPFAGKHMKLIDLNKVQQIRKASTIDTELNRETLGPLLDICLENIVLSKNSLRSISSSILNSTFVRCIMYFDASKNHLEGDFSFLYSLTDFQNLRVLDLSRTYQELNGLSLNKSNLSRKGLEIKKLNLNVACPPNLEHVLFHAGGSQQGTFFGNIKLINTSKLRKIDFSAIGTFGIDGKITGLSNVTYLDLSMNTLEASMFLNSDIVNLEVFKAERSVINFQFTKSITDKLQKLQNLNLASTGLEIIPANTMRNLVSVQHLILRGNRLDDIPDEIFHMPSLRHLDMSETAIRSLSDNTRSRLDELNTENNSFILDISGNTFMCSCYTLGFIQWIHETKVNLNNERNYPCVLTDGTVSDTASFYNDYLHQWRKCIGPGLFTISLVLVFTSALMIAATTFLQRFFPRIQHECLRLLGYHTKKALRRVDFRYDAYICYDDSDYQWSCHSLYQGLLKVNKNIRLYLSDIHSIPGEPKAESIIEAISESWKVVVVLSEKSFTDEWFYFSIMSAVRLLSSRGAITSRIILLYEDDTPKVRASIPDCLVNVIKESNVVSSLETGFNWLQINRMILDESDLDLFTNENNIY